MVGFNHLVVVDSKTGVTVLLALVLPLPFRVAILPSMSLLVAREHGRVWWPLGTNHKLEWDCILVWAIPAAVKLAGLATKNLSQSRGDECSHSKARSLHIAQRPQLGSPCFHRPGWRWPWRVQQEAPADCWSLLRDPSGSCLDCTRLMNAAPKDAVFAASPRIVAPLDLEADPASEKCAPRSKSVRSAASILRNVCHCHPCSEVPVRELAAF